MQSRVLRRIDEGCFRNVSVQMESVLTVRFGPIVLKNSVAGRFRRC